MNELFSIAGGKTEKFLDKRDRGFTPDIRR
jgi:hypothetical protein